MKISISVKWTVSVVLVVILVVFVYAGFMIGDARKSVERETERIQRIEYDALDQLGSQTTRAISQPASGLLYDNDREGLAQLLAPVVIGGGQAKQYYAVYATIIAPNRRIWAAAVNAAFDRLDVAGTAIFDREGDKGAAEEVDGEWFGSTVTLQSLPQAIDDVRTVRRHGQTEETEIQVRQYAHKIVSRSGETQGYLLIGYDIEGLSNEIAQIRRQGEERQADALSKSVGLAIIAVLIGLLMGILQSLLVTRNILKLSRTADRIADGDLSVRSDVRSHDEIGQLGKQFNAMADRVQELLVETEQKAMLEKEVDIARNIQATLMPPTGHAECGPVTLHGFFQPASECGGDFWSHHLLPDGSVLLTIGDVTGHGVPSAMITACAKSALDTLLSLSSGAMPLTEIMAGMNHAICQAAKRTLFMTFQAVKIAPNGRSCEIVNAGHNFPLLSHNGEVRSIVLRGMRLGDEENVTYESAQVELSPGDMFMIYTDGVTEYQNDKGAEYGEKRLRKVIAPLGAGDVDGAMESFWSDFRAFCGDAPQNDDITLMFAKV